MARIAFVQINVQHFGKLFKTNKPQFGCRRVQNIFSILQEKLDKWCISSFSQPGVCQYSQNLLIWIFYTGGFICIWHDFFTLIRRSWYQIKHIKSCPVLIGSLAAHHVGLRTRTRRSERRGKKRFNHGNRSIESDAINNGWRKEKQDPGC